MPLHIWWPESSAGTVRAQSVNGRKMLKIMAIAMHACGPVKPSGSEAFCTSTQKDKCRRYEVIEGGHMPVWRINVLKNGKPDVTRDITANEVQERDIIDLLRLMAARGLTSEEIIDAFWSESHGKVSPLTVQPHNAGATLSCGGGRYHATARRLKEA